MLCETFLLLHEIAHFRNIPTRSISVRKLQQRIVRVNLQMQYRSEMEKHLCDLEL